LSWRQVLLRLLLPLPLLLALLGALVLPLLRLQCGLVLPPLPLLLRLQFLPETSLGSLQ
jgi:hypothetical protein